MLALSVLAEGHPMHRRRPLKCQLACRIMTERKCRDVPLDSRTVLPCRTPSKEPERRNHPIEVLARLVAHERAPGLRPTRCVANRELK